MPWLRLAECHGPRARGQRLYSYGSGHDGSRPLSYFVEPWNLTDNQLTAGVLIGNAQEARGARVG
jgi:hypothetical protein